MKLLISVCIVLAVIVFAGCKDTPTTYNSYNYYTGDSLSDPNVQPRVVFTNPANGAVGPFTSYENHNTTTSPQITIQFNKLINILNLRDTSITLRDNDTSYGLTLSDMSYLYDSYVYSSPFLRNVLIFDVGYKYLAGKTYTATVDTTLADIHGYRLHAPYVFSFVPEPRFRVVSGSPASDGVSPLSFGPIMLNLNSKVDSSFFAKIQISPTIRGRWQSSYYYYYVGDSTYAYYSSNDTLPYETKYSISVAGDAKDVHGLLIDAPYQFSFTTAPFEVFLSSYSSYTGPGGFMVISSLDFSFNGPVDTSTVRHAISISPSLSFSISFYSGFYQDVYVNPDGDQMQRNTTYTITIDKTVRSRNGFYLKNPYSYSVTTGL